MKESFELKQAFKVNPAQIYEAWLNSEQHSEITQSWRTSEFEDNDEDSILTIKLDDIEGGTELTLIHKNIPAGQTQYKEGWMENYFEPMKDFFDRH